MLANRLIIGIAGGLATGCGTYAMGTQLNTQIPIQEEKMEETKEEIVENNPIPEEAKQMQMIEAQEHAPTVEKQQTAQILHKIPDVKETDDKELFKTVREGKIGDRFKDYLIGSKNNIEVWNRKIHYWIHNLGQDKGERWVTPPFRVRSSKVKASIEMLQTKCQRAYEREGLNDAPLFNKRQLNTKLQKAQYWADVWTYCARETVETPKGWPQ